MNLSLLKRISECDESNGEGCKVCVMDEFKMHRDADACLRYGE